MRLPPPTDLVEGECGLRLRASEAELAGEAGTEPRGGVGPQLAQAIRDLPLRQRFDRARQGDQLVERPRLAELDGAGAVVADLRREQRERRRHGHTELAPPAVEDVGVVRQKAPEPGTDDPVGVHADRRSHGHRQRRGARVVEVAVVVAEAQPARPAFDATDRRAVEQHDQSVGRRVRGGHRDRPSHDRPAPA